ncbi:Abhydrolase domain-containing protein 12, partial [Operophtera brumata]
LLILGATISVGAFIFHIAVVPLVFKYSKTFRRTLVPGGTQQDPRSRASFYHESYLYLLAWKLQQSRDIPQSTAIQVFTKNGFPRYADSTKVNPSEAGVVEDSLVVYEWLLNITRKNGHKTPIFVWGHSLGTGISSSFLGNLDVSLVQARQDGGGASVEFHGYEKKEKLGHRYIVKASNLQQVL